MATAKARTGDYDRYNPLAVARYLPASPRLEDTLRRVNALLSTTYGMDRAGMIIQYSAPLFAALLTKSVPTYSRAVTVSVPYSKSLKTYGLGLRRAEAAQVLVKFSSIISDARTLARFAGLLPILSWMLSLEKKETAPKNDKLRTIERIQAWSMLAYYPFEHLYYLAAHGIISLSASQKTRVSVLSCRAWAVYVILQLAHLYEQSKELSSQARVLVQKRQNRHDLLTSTSKLDSSEKQTPESAEGGYTTDLLIERAGEVMDDAALVMQEQSLQRQSQAIISQYSTNLAYLPLTIHWSLQSGLWKNELWSAVFGTVAAYTSLKAAWQSTA